VVLADTVHCRAKDECLATLRSFIQEGSVTPVVDRRYSFEQLPEAIAYQEGGHAAGKVVVAL
jgi:NADPH:quinone reductase-like Zn-dependent oxidoreductase